MGYWASRKTFSRDIQMLDIDDFLTRKTTQGGSLGSYTILKLRKQGVDKQ